MSLEKNHIDITNSLVKFNQKLNNLIKELEELKQDNQQLHETFGDTGEIDVNSYKQTG